MWNLAMLIRQSVRRVIGIGRGLRAIDDLIQIAAPIVVVLHTTRRLQLVKDVIGVVSRYTIDRHRVAITGLSKCLKTKLGGTDNRHAK